MIKYVKKLKINRHLFNKGTDVLTGYCGHLSQGVRLPICVGSKAPYTGNRLSICSMKRERTVRNAQSVI